MLPGLHETNLKGGGGMGTYVKSRENSMVFNILIRKEDKIFVAHCLELDIVAARDTLDEAEKEIFDLVSAQVGYAFRNNNLDNLYHPAPPEVWREFYACKERSSS
jgi:predicted RNase H-like HicB family nuclease